MTQALTPHDEMTRDTKCRVFLTNTQFIRADAQYPTTRIMLKPPQHMANIRTPSTRHVLGIVLRNVQSTHKEH